MHDAGNNNNEAKITNGDDACTSLEPFLYYLDTKVLAVGQSYVN
jgi:hypothetical protein